MKRVLLGAVLALSAPAVTAQHLPKLGIKGGLNIANLSSESGANLSSRLSGHGGVVVHVHLSRQWAFQPEVVYSSQGTKQRVGNNELNWNLDYLNVPFMLQYMFGNGFRVEAGPQVGLLLSAKIKDASGSTNIKNNLKEADFGAGFGLSYLSHSGFGIGGRYNLGITSINKTGTNDLRNRVGQISVFYMFGSDHKTRTRR